MPNTYPVVPIANGTLTRAPGAVNEKRMRPAMAQCKVLGGLLLGEEEEEEGRGGWKEEEGGKRGEGNSSSAERVAGKEGRRWRMRSLLMMPPLLGVGPGLGLLLGSSIMVFLGWGEGFVLLVRAAANPTVGET